VSSNPAFRAASGACRVAPFIAAMPVNAYRPREDESSENIGCETNLIIPPRQAPSVKVGPINSRVGGSIPLLAIF